jgi:hypothetical protein
MNRYKIPTLFYLDHANRGLPAGKLIKSGKLFTIVELTDSEYLELLDDAKYYADFKGSDDYAENRSIVNSAINTIKYLTNN